MSFLFKFIDSGFLLTLGLILLISGGVMLYCYRRLNLLEKSVIEHGKILQNFIMNYNIQMQHFSLANNSFNRSKSIYEENNTTEYVEFDKIKKINLGEKISVSDNEEEDEDEDEGEEEDEGECEDEGEDEDEGEGEDEDEDEGEEEGEDESEDDDEGEDEDEGKKKNLEMLIISNNKFEKELQTIESLEIVEHITSLENMKLNDQTISTIDDETFMNNLPINLKSFTLETNNDPKIINLENIDDSSDKTGEKKNYSKMKVDDLKTLVVTRNLTDNETSQKMKKSDLVKLLQNK